MRIIRQGQIPAVIDPATIEHELTCFKCETVFAFAESEADVKPDQYLEHDRSLDTLKTACPFCGQSIVLSRRMIDALKTHRRQTEALRKPKRWWRL